MIHVLGEEAVGDRLAAAPFRAEAFSRWIRDYAASTYRQISSQGEDPALSGLINVVTVDVEPEHAGAFSRWYDDVHVPEILDCPGWLGARRYRSIDHDGCFMAVYGLEDAERPFGTAEYEEATGWDEHVEHIRGYHGFRIYRIVTLLEGSE